MRVISSNSGRGIISLCMTCSPSFRYCGRCHIRPLTQSFKHAACSFSSRVARGTGGQIEGVLSIPPTFVLSRLQSACSCTSVVRNIRNPTVPPKARSSFSNECAKSAQRMINCSARRFICKVRLNGIIRCPLRKCFSVVRPVRRSIQSQRNPPCPGRHISSNESRINANLASPSRCPFRAIFFRAIKFSFTMFAVPRKRRSLFRSRLSHGPTLLNFPRGLGQFAIVSFLRLFPGLSHATLGIRLRRRRRRPRLYRLGRSRQAGRP